MSWVFLSLAVGAGGVVGLLWWGYRTFQALARQMERDDIGYLARIGWPATHPAPEPGIEGFAERPETAAEFAKSDDKLWSDHARAFAVEPRLLRFGLPNPEERSPAACDLARRHAGIMVAAYGGALAVLTIGAVTASRTFLIPLGAVAAVLIWRWLRAAPWPGTAAALEAHRKRLSKSPPRD